MKTPIIRGIVAALVVAIASCSHIRTFPEKCMFGVSRTEGVANITVKHHGSHYYRPWLIEYRELDEWDFTHIQTLQTLGVKFYHFAISWALILPSGDVNDVCKTTLEYYNRYINLLVRCGIEPVITIHHGDLPKCLIELGGWANPVLEEYYVEYARLLFTFFGDRVKWWITFNEPEWICRQYADDCSTRGVGNYLAGHTILKAHARVYHLYADCFRHRCRGNVGISLYCPWYEPKSLRENDLYASELSLQFHIGWFAHPICSSQGDYPILMRTIIDRNSRIEGRALSRLPKFTEKWVNYICGTFDFLGVSHYTTVLVTQGIWGPCPSLTRDCGVIESCDESWPITGYAPFKVVPWGLRKVLNWIKRSYCNPPVLITQSGCADDGGVEDTIRVEYYTLYLEQLLNVIYEDGCNILGYGAWSLFDHHYKFGLCIVEHSAGVKKTVLKSSARIFAEIIRTRTVDPNSSCSCS